MIIWSGFGFLVVVFGFVFSLAAYLITNSVAGSDAYWDAHRLPLGVSLFFSAAACWLLGRFFHNREESHTLFFIPMLYWGLILAAIGLVAVISEFVK
jgi:hypothetical protein